MSQAKLVDRFFKRGGEFLGVETPIICGAMTWVSTPGLAKAVTDAGGFACLAGQSVGLVDECKPVAEIMKEIVDATEEELQRVRNLLG